jgi:hypothetical protein
MRQIFRLRGGLRNQFPSGSHLSYRGIREVLDQAARRLSAATALSESGEDREARDGKQHINEVGSGLGVRFQS